MVSEELQLRRAESLLILNRVRQHYTRPAVLCSFGKDSMAMIGLLRELGLNWPVIHFRDPFRPRTNLFGAEMAAKYRLQVYEWAPSEVFFVHEGGREARINPTLRYTYNETSIDIPRELIEQHNKPPTGEFVCGLDWIAQPRTPILDSIFDCLVIGHKSSDTDPLLGKIPLKNHFVESNGVMSAFPLKSWEDATVWEYLNEQKIPTDARRYDRSQLPPREYEGKPFNPDWMTGCVNCFHPCGSAEQVYCPARNEMISRFPGETTWLKPEQWLKRKKIDYFQPEHVSQPEPEEDFEEEVICYD